MIFDGSKVTDAVTDDTPIGFGKYQKRGLSPRRIAEIDPQYIVWLFDETDTNIVSEELAEECRASTMTNKPDESDMDLEAVDSFMRHDGKWGLEHD